MCVCVCVCLCVCVCVCVCMSVCAFENVHTYIHFCRKLYSIYYMYIRTHIRNIIFVNVRIYYICVYVCNVVHHILVIACQTCVKTS